MPIVCPSWWPIGQVLTLIVLFIGGVSGGMPTGGMWVLRWIRHVVWMYPIGSMFSIFTYIYHTNQPNVGIKPYMDLMGIGEIHVYHFGLHARSWCFITFRLDFFSIWKGVAAYSSLGGRQGGLVVSFWFCKVLIWNIPSEDSSSSPSC